MKSLLEMGTGWALFAVVALVAACADDTSSGARSTAGSVAVSQPGEQCEHGGIEISTGIDKNGNGVLDPDEIQDTAVVCAGAPGEGGPDGEPGGNGDDGTLLLTDVTDVAAGDDCDDGGVVIEVGLDDDGDGELDDEEIDQSATVCNGADGPPGADGALTLTRIDAIATGDEVCAAGGREINVGLDNGDGEDGVAGDGVLQDGEIDSSAPVCDGDPLFPIDRASFDPPTGDPGPYRVDGSGGSGTGGPGGQGAGFTVTMATGSLLGDIAFFDGGSLEIDTAPPDIEVDTGDTGVAFSADTNVARYETDSSTVEGEVFFLGDGDTLFQRSGGVVVPVSGFEVAEGVTVTFAGREGPRVWVVVPAGVRNAGTLTTALNGSAHWDITVTANVFVGESGSAIDVSGADGDGEPGVDGSNVSLFADVVVNAGTIDVSGGDGTSGGSGGALEYILFAGSGWQSGAILAHGGDGSAGIGGSGGSGLIVGISGTVGPEGSIDVSGGSGTAGGGSGGEILMGNEGLASISNAGTLDASGGDVADTCTTPDNSCQAGAGGSVQFYAQTQFATAGRIDVSGGSAPSGTGGAGGGILIDSQTARGVNAGIVPIESVAISGDWDASGGDGVNGSNAGEIVVTVDIDEGINGQTVRFYGYGGGEEEAGIDLSGGSGTKGADGGSFTVINTQTGSEAGYPVSSGPSGGVFNEVDVTARGGSSSDGQGGWGGSVYLGTDFRFGYAAPDAAVINHGALDLSGGFGSERGGNGGFATLAGVRGVHNDAGIVTSGGGVAEDCVLDEAKAPDGPSQCEGGFAGTTTLQGDLGWVRNDGDLIAQGGDSPGNSGGRGGWVEMLGRRVSNAGDIASNGGDGDADGTETWGGDGGNVTFYGFNEPSDVAGVIETSGGTGSDPGETGTVMIDGVIVVD